MTEQFIGNYRVVNMVGQGGMGKVYLAVHKDVPNLRVILKILSDPRLADRFKQEADKLALLDGHPNICKIKHFFHHGDELVIAMEYIDGETLDERLKTEKRLPISESIRIVCDMLAILSYAHERGISHRDIKPSNVMIDKAGQVKIIDFGIAKGKSDPNLTMTGASLGTPAYMAPEQFIPTDTTDYALADVYACGTTLYQMVTGELPFKGDNEFVLRDAKLMGTPPKPRSLNPGVSKELEGIILKAIDKDPAQRYASADEMRKALQLALRDDSARADKPTQSIQQMPPPSPVRNKKSSGAKLAGIGFFVIIVAVAVWWTVFHKGGPKAPAAPELLAPANNAQFTDQDSIGIAWSPSAGPDGRYMIEYSNDSLFEIPKKISWNTNQFIFPPGLEAGTWYWQVTPMTGAGVEGKVSERRRFVVESAAPAVAQGTLAIDVDPSGDIYVGDRLLARDQSSATTTLDTGRYAIRVVNEKAKERVLRDTVRVSAGQETSRAFRFTFAEATPQPPTVKPREVRVGSRPRGAKIYVDGALQPVQTNNTVWLKPGRHIVSVSLEQNGAEQTRADTVNITADSVYKVLFEFEQ